MDQRKIAFVGFWRGFNPHHYFLTHLLKEKYDVIITDIESADYLFFADASEDHWKVGHNCIKIFYTGEMVSPDFNACDYAIGFDLMEYGDRYYRLPLYYNDEYSCKLMECKHQCDVKELIEKKKEFCSITVSNEKRDPFFKEIYHELSKYKKVDSGGKWNNNINGRVSDKLSFDSTHKFSIVCENCSFPGYTTEKLVEAFAANCIPIYWGDPEITKVFNPKAFINVKDFSSIGAVADEVMKIDTDVSLYERMIQEPVYIDRKYLYSEQMDQFKQFLFHIFDTPFEAAMRRNQGCSGVRYVRLRRIQRAWTMPYFKYRAIRRTMGDLLRKML